MKRNLPETSHIANAMKTDESKEADYNKIIKALTILGTGNYEQISDVCSWTDPNKASRRTKEMVEKGLIYNTGVKNLTKRKRQAFMYAIKNTDTVLPKPPEVNYKRQKVTAALLAANIINTIQTKGYVQPELFK